jgi:hypothetical protein
VSIDWVECANDALDAWSAAERQYYEALNKK